MISPCNYLFSTACHSYERHPDSDHNLASPYDPSSFLTVAWIKDSVARSFQTMPLKCSGSDRHLLERSSNHSTSLCPSLHTPRSQPEKADPSWHKQHNRRKRNPMHADSLILQRPNQKGSTIPQGTRHQHQTRSAHLRHHKHPSCHDYPRKGTQQPMKLPPIPRIHPRQYCVHPFYR